MGTGTLVVLDTNVLVSAFGWEGPERDVYRLCRRGELETVTSRPLLEELERVLGYPKFGLDHEEVEAVLADVKSVAGLVEPERAVRAVSEDPADDRVLECAVTSGADYIVSGDQHLLTLDAYEGVSVVRASELLDRLGASDTQ